MEEKIQIGLPNGAKHEFSKGVTGKDIALSIGQRLAEAALAVTVNGKMIDLATPILEDAQVTIITFDTPEGKELFWHSTAHILAQAVKRLYPTAKPTIGPAIDEGFYYDFDMEPISPKDLERIEEEMKKIAHEKLIPKRIEYKTSEEAKKVFANNEYKIELIEEHGDVSAYEQGEFIDLCRGPHIPTTGKIKALKLTKVSGSYWRADIKNKQLQRIYGISYPDKKMLKEYVTRIEEAEKRNHRKLGKEMELFDVFEEAPGMPFFFPSGAVIWNELEGFVRGELQKRDYVEVKTPLIMKRELWEKSGHWDHYKDNMYFVTIDGEDFAIKPMNCPGHTLIYGSRTRSYRELPIRMAEFGMVHRHEMSGVLYGLLRVRKFTQDDAHVFCTPEQLEEEIVDCIDFTDKVLSTFGFKYKVELSTKPDDAMGSQEIWDKAESALKNALASKKVDYKLNEGDGAFYGPKIDFHITDCLNRSWQLSTIQVDFSMPERFDMTYVGEDGQNTHRPVMVHRAILGSLERFIGILVEHYAGKFPLWIAPTQVIICTVAERFDKYAQGIAKKLREEGLRVKVDARAESVPKKVRDAQLLKIPYICIVGEKEEGNGTFNYRTRDNEVHGPVPVEDFLKMLVAERDARD